MTRQPDDTARGIVIPLAAVALVCLLLTSGVFLFAGSDRDKGRGRPVSRDVNMPLPAPAPVFPDAGSPSPGATTTTTAGPTKSVTRSPSASASATASTSPTATRSSAPPTSAAPPVPPPPATTGPKDITVDATVSDSGWGADGTVVITNRTAHPLPSWDLTLTATGRQSGFTMLYGEDMRTSTDRGTATARGRGPLAPGASAVIEFGLYGRVESIGCTFTGVTCHVRGLDAGHG